MKYTIIAAVAIAGLLLLPVMAQDSGGSKSLAATIGVYVFPAEGQTAEQQSMDEVECYNWAVGQTGTDPFDLSKQAEAQAQAAADAQAQIDQSGQGAGAKGAVGGAAAGAVVGAIAGDTGKGAAIGAGAGLIAGRRGARRAKSDASDQVDKQSQQAQQATQEQLDNFKKAFSVCLEAKDYMVK